MFFNVPGEGSRSKAKGGCRVTKETGWLAFSSAQGRSVWTLPAKQKPVLPGKSVKFNGQPDGGGSSSGEASPLGRFRRIGFLNVEFVHAERR